MTQRTPQISPVTALAFQAAIAGIGGLAVWLMGISVAPATATGWAQATVWGLGGSVVTYLILSALSRAPGAMKDSLAGHMRQLRQFACDYSWPTLIALSVLAGVGEELLFRGAVQNWLARHFNDWVAVAAAAILFGLVHYLSFVYFVIATGFGVVLGAAYLLTDSLLLVMVWHGAYDMIALYSLRRFPHWFGVAESPNRM